MNAYIQPAVKIELGARGAGNPFNICKISSFIMENIPDADISDIEIKILAAERTFILHMYANWLENKKPLLRQPQHYFDSTN